MIDEKNMAIVLETLAEKIKSLKVDLMLKDMKIAELEEKLAEAEKRVADGKD